MKMPNLKSAESSVPNSTTTLQGIGSRYRNLIISIAVFLSLIAALLAYTFYTTSILQKNTALIITASRVADGTQAVIKDLFDMQNSYGEDFTSPHMQTVIKRLRENTAAIDKNLAAIASSSVITESDGTTLVLPQITDPVILRDFATVTTQWNELKPVVNDYLKVADDITVDSSTLLGVATDQAKISTLTMNDSLFALTKGIYSQPATQLNTIRLIQIFGALAILIYFIVFIVVFVRRLRESDMQAEISRRETDDIMKNVNTGLFLLDKDLNIGNQYSAQLENIIGESEVAGRNLSGLLQNKVSAKDLETTQSFVKQLYNTRVKEKLVNDLNPLKKVMINDSKNQSRFLDFKFSRVYAQNQIEKILVNVQDVTQQVRLEQRLEQERAQNDLQIEMLTTILNVNPVLINEFIQNTQQNIIKVNNILKNPGSQQHELEEKLSGMYRIMHSLKGEASALKLHSFIAIANNFEEKLKALQNKGKLSGNDFLPLTIHLDELLNLSNTIESLGKRINQGIASLAATANTTTTTTATATPNPVTNAGNGQKAMQNLETPAPTPSPNNNKSQLYQQLADGIALRQNKQVVLKTQGLNEVELPREMDNSLKEIIIQLIRNSVVHGIETPEQRALAGKSKQGTVKLTLLDLAESYKLTIEDDGKGIDYQSIRNRAIEMGYNPDDVNQWEDSRLASLLFKSGFSTYKASDEDAGRGVGMDIIKERVNDLHGKLALDTQFGQFTRFIIKIPKNPVL